MKFQEFFHFCLDKMLVTNKDNFETFLEAFELISEKEGKIEYLKFPQLMTAVAKKLIPGQKRPILALLNDYLGDKTVAVEDTSTLFFLTESPEAQNFPARGCQQTPHILQHVQNLCKL